MHDLVTLRLPRRELFRSKCCTSAKFVPAIYEIGVCFIAIEWTVSCLARIRGDVANTANKFNDDSFLSSLGRIVISECI